MAYKVQFSWQAIDPFMWYQVLDILYQTEDGFAVPDEEDCPPPPEDEEEYWARTLHKAFINWTNLDENISGI